MRARRLLGWALVAAFAVGSTGAGLILHQRAIDDFQRSQDNLAARAANQAQSAAATSVSQLTGEAAFFEASDVVTPREFRVFTRPLLDKGTISGTAFVPRVTDGRRSRFEDNRNFHIFDLGPNGPEDAADRAAYFPVTYSAFNTGGAMGAEGFDLSSDPRQLSAITNARDQGSAAATDIGKLRVTGGTGFVVYQPIYRRGVPLNSVSARRKALAGFAVGTFQGEDIATAALAGAPDDTVAQVLEQGVPVIGAAQKLDGASSATIRIAGRVWTLVVVDPNRPAAATPFIIGGAGLLLALMLAGLLITWGRRERYALALVDERIAERDEAEAERRRSAQQYELLAENATDVITVHDTDGVITYISPSCEAVFGWKPEDLMGTGGFERIHPDDREATIALAQPLRVETGAITFQSRFRCKDGRYVWVETALRSVAEDDGEAPTEMQGATRNIAERKALEEELARLAHEDPLTGLTNRRRFEEELDAELARTRRNNGKGAVLLIDLDHFKQVNDTYGHAAGDTLLIEIADLLGERLRESDVVGRLGGDEFAAILPTTDEREARLAAEALVKAIREHRGSNPEWGPTSACIGIALFSPDPRETPDTVMAEADIAMYRAKQDGRDRVRTYDLGRDADARSKADPGPNEREGRASRPDPLDS